MYIQGETLINLSYLILSYLTISVIPMFTWCKKLSVLLKCIKSPKLKLVIELSNIETVRKLVSIRNKILYVVRYQI